MESMPRVTDKQNWENLRASLEALNDGELATLKEECLIVHNETEALIHGINRVLDLRKVAPVIGEEAVRMSTGEWEQPVLLENA